MSLWAIFTNIGKVISLFKALSSVIGGVAKDKKMPPNDQIKAVLDCVEDLLDSGAIDIPGVDEKAISDALKQIEEQLLG